jgi:hypothetical protein
MSRTKRTFPQFDGSPTTPPRPHPPRPPPVFRSDFGDSQRNTPDSPRRRQRTRVHPGAVVPLAGDRPLRQIEPPRPSAVDTAPVNNENAATAAPVHLPVTKIIEPPNIRKTLPRPSTPPRSLPTPNLTSFISPSRSRPSKPVSSTHIARATDVLTDSGRAELFGLTLVRDDATPMEKAVRRGLETTPRKAGIGKEIRYTR